MMLTSTSNLHQNDFDVWCWCTHQIFWDDVYINIIHHTSHQTSHQTSIYFLVFPTFENLHTTFFRPKLKILSWWPNLLKVRLRKCLLFQFRLFLLHFNVKQKKLNWCIFFTSMPKTLHQKFYIKHHEKYFDVDVDVTSYMMYVMYDVPIFYLNFGVL